MTREEIMALDIEQVEARSLELVAEVENAETNEAMDAVRDYFMAQEKATAYMDFDGYRVEFPDWWFNIRPSNTEPYLRFLCEATSKELLDEKVAKVREIIEQYS